ncbi:MAG: T9SS type A sorting domain-containing protein, partial [Ignavibacteriaceae bacterium]|nr:T9SS type A sorting domain-containing protein [Ignavibacteriaceae bacterium]
IKEEGLVTLKVYDILGKEVAELVNENKPAGVYEVSFNASNLPSGMYIYKLQSGSFTDVKKMLLTK